jgi:hypothetical protein
MKRGIAAVIAVALGVAAYFGLRAWRQREARRIHDVVVRVVDHTSSLEGCLLGNGAIPTRPDALNARVRRLALGTPRGALWVTGCASHLDALKKLATETPRPTDPLRALAPRIEDLHRVLMGHETHSALTRFRAGDGAEGIDAWVAPLQRLHAQTAALARTEGLRAPVARVTNAPRLLPTVTEDVLPFSLDPGSVLDGVNLAGGVFSVLFVEPSRDRVFCRTRDEGTSIRCQRFATRPDGDIVTWLVAHDRPEALVLVDHAGRRATLPSLPVMSVASIDALDQPLYTLSAPIAQSLPLAVSEGMLYAMTRAGETVSLERVGRGSAARSSVAAGVPSGREAVITLAGGRAWWISVGENAAHSPVLLARSLPGSVTEALAPPAEVTALRASSALLSACRAGERAWVMVNDAPLTRLVVIDADGARVVGEPVRVDIPAAVTCDDGGAVLAGETHAHHCTRDGCSQQWEIPGLRRFARVDGEVVEVYATRDGGSALRVRHATPERFVSATAAAIDDDAAHGGLSAQGLWLFTVGHRLVLFVAGSATSVLWSEDHGDHWHAAREAVETRAPARSPARPPRPSREP